MRKYRTSDSPFYDKEFAARTVRRANGLGHTKRAPLEPDHYSTNISCRDCATEARIEGAGLLARTALEADLSLTGQLIDVRYRNRRVHGILKFLLQLGADPDNEREMMKAVIQAATVWFDADCRIYQRQPDDSFLLAAMLPGATEQRGGVRLEAMRVEKLVASR